MVLSSCIFSKFFVLLARAKVASVKNLRRMNVRSSARSVARAKPLKKNTRDWFLAQVRESSFERASLSQFSINTSFSPKLRLRFEIYF